MNTLRPAILLFVLLSIITGIVYPLLITGVAQVAFPAKANGSIVERGGKPIGSRLIGQEFSTAEYFWGRPSATGPVPYNSFNADTLTGSSGSNLAPTNPTLVSNIQARTDALHAADKSVGYSRPADSAIPVDLLTSSGSGLDPHISPEATEYQLPRVARARGLSEAAVRDLVRTHTSPRQFGLLGEPVVNVLAVNLALNELPGAGKAIHE